jgi:hypothetical protein
MNPRGYVCGIGLREAKPRRVSLVDRQVVEQTSSVGAAITPVASSRPRRCASVKRVEVALSRAAGSRHLALRDRIEGAILIGAPAPHHDVHANRKSRIICLRLRLPCRRSRSNHQNRQSHNAHRNFLRDRHNISAPSQTNYGASSQFTFPLGVSPNFTMFSGTTRSGLIEAPEAVQRLTLCRSRDRVPARDLTVAPNRGKFRDARRDMDEPAKVGV